MRHRQPTLPSTKFADRRRKKKPITPENQAKMAANEKRHLEKLERHAPTDPRYAGLVLGALAVEARGTATAGLIAALLGLTPEETNLEPSPES
jgi:hypothetical protein